MFKFTKKELRQFLLRNMKRTFSCHNVKCCPIATYLREKYSVSRKLVGVTQVASCVHGRMIKHPQWAKNFVALVDSVEGKDRISGRDALEILDNM